MRWLVLLVMSIALAAWAAPRAKSARAEFQRANPCPSNGAQRGACPGWVVDHVEPLCAGGADAPSNMQWQTVADARVKDREEVRQCRLRKQRANLGSREHAQDADAYGELPR